MRLCFTNLANGQLFTALLVASLRGLEHVAFEVQAGLSQLCMSGPLVTPFLLR